MKKLSSRKECEAYAKDNGLKLNQYFYREHGNRCFSHQIELPRDLYTQSGQTGFASEDQLCDLSAAKYWFLVLEEMKTLVSDSPWLSFDEAQAEGLSV